ncbi:MAG: amidohydrolase family protein [Lachnospiraceae bacterium]|nr:amidohydrolase family protein [Lachnospiraceae bacterium]
MIIDMHTHIFPQRIAASAYAAMERNVYEKRKEELRIKISGTREALAKSGDVNRIDLSVVLPVATKPSQTESINSFAKETNERTAESGVMSFGAIHPDNGDYKEILLELHRMGFAGIKLHPDYQGVNFDDERYLRIIEAASDLGMVIVTHAGEDVGIPEKVRCTPDRILRVLEIVRPPKLVLAHMGGWNMWEEVEQKLVGKPVYFDTSFVFEPIVTQMDEAQFIRIVRSHGADKILFATDSPWSDQGKYVEKIRKMPFSDEEKKRIFSENAIRLLGIDRQY